MGQSPLNFPLRAEVREWFFIFLIVHYFCALIQICRIQNVSHLSELKVLNLAGNNISNVENVQGLDNLTELNLRNNFISLLVREYFHISLLNYVCGANKL